MEMFKLFSWLLDGFKSVLWSLTCDILDWLFDSIDALVALVPTWSIAGQNSAPLLSLEAQALLAQLQIGPMLLALLACYPIRLLIKTIPFVRW